MTRGWFDCNADLLMARPRQQRTRRRDACTRATWCSSRAAACNHATAAAVPQPCCRGSRSRRTRPRRLEHIRIPAARACSRPRPSGDRPSAHSEEIPDPLLLLECRLQRILVPAATVDRPSTDFSTAVALTTVAASSPAAAYVGACSRARPRGHATWNARRRKAREPPVPDLSASTVRQPASSRLTTYNSRCIL